VLSDLQALDRFPWTGHSALLGTIARPWQDTTTILAQFGPTVRRARHAYRIFVAAGLPQGRRPEFQGGGLVRSLGGWEELRNVRRTGVPVQADARILGTGDFVDMILRASIPAEGAVARVSLETLAARLAASLGVALPAIGSRCSAGAPVTWRGPSGRPEEMSRRPPGT
jgi:hypothetical protein